MRRRRWLLLLLLVPGCGPGDPAATVPLEQTGQEVRVTLSEGGVLKAWAQFEEEGEAGRGPLVPYAPFTVTLEVRTPSGISETIDCSDWGDRYQVVSGAGFAYVSFPQCNLEAKEAGEYTLKATRVRRPDVDEDWRAENASLLFIP